MRYLNGKIIGFILGLVCGGPGGAFIGLILGHLHDKGLGATVKGATTRWTEQSFHPGLVDSFQRETYAVGVVVLGAKMAKADGHVSRLEVETFKRVFHIPEIQAAKVGELFDYARKSSDGYEPYALRLAQVFRRNPLILEEILTGLFIVAASDSMGLLSPSEARFLGRVASLFDFTSNDFMRIAARSGVRLPTRPSAQPTRDMNYVVLGLPENATPEEIKKTYRALVRKHHPDKLAAEGLPPELIAQATEKIKRINAAYEEISKARNIK